VDRTLHLLRPGQFHKLVRAVMKNWKILRDYRHAAETLRDAASGIARLHNLTITG
jgi:hypothetical protein